MIVTDSGESFLLLQFRDFYREVIRLKEATRRGATVSVGLEMHAEDRGGIATPEAMIRSQLLGILDQQMRMAMQFGGTYIAAHEEARYIMVALADEIFLHSDWEGRHTWNFNLLETYFYQTHVAGDLFFQRIDQLMGTRDPMKLELAKIYLMALALGFQGKYRGSDPKGDLIRYRNLLYDYISQGSHPLREGKSPLFPETAKHILGTSQITLLPPLRKWLMRLLVVILIFLGIQQIVWRYFLTADLRHSVEKILTEDK